MGQLINAAERNRETKWFWKFQVELNKTTFQLFHNNQSFETLYINL